MTAALSNRHRKWLGWLNLLARFASVQLVIQVLGFLSGILIVRHLSKPDYAWFTIANTFVATLGMLADCGVLGACSAVGGTIWQDKVKFSSLILTALSFRRKLAIAAVLILTGPFIWMLAKKDAPVAVIAVVVPVALLGFFLQMTVNLLSSGMWYRQQLRRLQLLGLAPAIFRTALIALACLLVLDARVAITIGTVSFVLQVLLLYRWERDSLDWRAPYSPEYAGRIRTILKKQAPLTIFHCVQGQLVVWLISIFGGKDQVAEIGALGRFAIIFTVVSPVINNVILPRFARCQDPAMLKRRYRQIALGFVAMAGALVTFAAIFPKPLIWLIGAKYANLEGQVWLMMLYAALGGTFGCLVSLTYVKGWILPAAISIPMEIATQVILILCFDLAKIRSVLIVGCIGQIPPILLAFIVAQRELKKAAQSPPPPAVADAEPHG
jgi:O-antigen/teichoic acid export membrane protein